MMPELTDSGVPQNVSQILVGYYKDAADRLGKLVLNPPGKTVSSREFRMARASQLSTQIDSIMRKLDSQASDWVGKHIPAATVEGAKKAVAQAEALGVHLKESTVGGSFTPIDQGTVHRFALDTYADLHKASDSMGDVAKYALHRTAQIGLNNADINKILAGGVIDGEPVNAIRQLRGALQAIHGEKVKIVDKNGRPMEFDVGYYASMVARTKTREATVAARHDRLESLGLDLVSIVGLVSKNFCTAFLGQVFSLSGKSDQYPSYDELPGGGPPFHPNCSKSTRPFVAALASDKQLELAKGTGDASELLGMDTSQAQRSFQDLQLYAQVKKSYATTADKLFGAAA